MGCCRIKFKRDLHILRLRGEVEERSELKKGGITNGGPTPRLTAGNGIILLKLQLRDGSVFLEGKLCTVINIALHFLYSIYNNDDGE